MKHATGKAIPPSTGATTITDDLLRLLRQAAKIAACYGNPMSDQMRHNLRKALREVKVGDPNKPVEPSIWQVAMSFLREEIEKLFGTADIRGRSVPGYGLNPLARTAPTSRRGGSGLPACA